MSTDHIVHRSAASGGSDNWQTPAKVLEPVRAIGVIGLDVATSKRNPTKALEFFTERTNGLEQSWAHPERTIVFCNPPYSNNKAWLLKAEEEAGKGAEIVLLIPARTGAKYFAPCWRAQAINFIEGRLIFNDDKTGAPRCDKHKRPMPAGFNSCLVYWGPRPARFKRATKHLGTVLLL
jgi:phage N-6-adenine-methyltransferase